MIEMEEEIEIWVVAVFWIPIIKARNQLQLSVRKGSETVDEREVFPVVYNRCHLLSRLSVYCHCHYE